MTDWKRRAAIIGYGAITGEILSALGESGLVSPLAGIVVRPARLEESRRRAAGRVTVVGDLRSLLDLEPDVVIECAGHGALEEYGPAVLGRGIDLVVASVGALADAGIAAECARAASGAARIWIPSGAVAGIDGLIASRTAGLRHVTYTSIKPPAAWIGTPAEAALAKYGEGRRVAFFEGTARDAARSYPKNANVGATVAFAGLGLDATRVVLVSDPEARSPLGIIEARGDFGSFRFEILAHASPANPKTSLLTAHSLIAAWQRRICFAVSAAELATREVSE